MSMGMKIALTSLVIFVFGVWLFTAACDAPRSPQRYIDVLGCVVLFSMGGMLAGLLIAIWSA